MEYDSLRTDQLYESDATGRWVYQYKWVLHKVNNVVRICEDAGRYTTLDAWLKALDEGKLLAGVIVEKDIAELPGLGEIVASTIKHHARKRRNSWPRSCSACCSQFIPDRGNLKRCKPCRSKKAVAR